MTDTTNSGTVSVAELRHILMRTGEKLSAKEGILIKVTYYIG